MEEVAFHGGFVHGEEITAADEGVELADVAQVLGYGVVGYSLNQEVYAEFFDQIHDQPPPQSRFISSSEYNCSKVLLIVLA